MWHGTLRRLYGSRQWRADPLLVMKASDMTGKSVTTIEGISGDGSHPVQAAWAALDVPQCGYCQAGQMMWRARC